MTFVSGSVGYGILNPQPSEQYFAMWVLGATGMAQNYYPGNNPNLVPGENLNWTVGVYNHMGSIQYIVVRVKLINSTLPAPNDLTSQPSPESSIFEFTRVLLNNETWSIPFVWEILSTSQNESTLQITKLSINGIVINGDLARAVSGFDYRFVFELWFYDETTNKLSFSLQNEGEPRSIWTQIWFNATLLGS